MGVGLRIFIVNDDNSLERLSLKTYERLNKSDPNTSIAKFANKSVRCIEVLLDLEERKPIAINRITYPILIFDSDGRLNAADLRDLSLTVINILPGFEESGDVIEASHLFAERKYKHKYIWSPTPEIEETIIKTIFSDV